MNHIVDALVRRLLPFRRIGKYSLQSIIRSVQRVRAFLTKSPVHVYNYGRWRLGGWWQALVDPFSDIRDASFFARLDSRMQELAQVRRAVRGGDYAVAKSELITYFSERQSPKFHFAWADRAKLLSCIKKEQKEVLVRAADCICQNLFSFRRVTVQFNRCGCNASGIDWMHTPGGNTDWRWDLNRHSYFITLGKAYWYTGRSKYARKFVALLLDWIATNPAGVGKPNWDSVLEVAVRLDTWIWAYFLFSQAGALQDDEHLALLKGILIHARFLAARIEWHAANNHLLLEAKALAFCGLLFPEFKDGSRWRTSGLNVLWKEVIKQVCPDGVHAERSPLYHRRVLSALLEMVVLLENNGLPVPEAVLCRAERMLAFDRGIAKPDGTLPLFGDSALAEIQVRFSDRGGGAMLLDRIKLDGYPLDEEMAWLLGRRDIEQLARMRANCSDGGDDLISTAFPRGGYLVMRAGRGEQGLYSAFDCGPFGYDAVPVHGHADALSFVLYAYGRSLITDCGVYSYHLGEAWRNYFRGTRAHNTIVVDGEDQSILFGTRGVWHPARATLHQWRSGEDLDWVDGSHDGYCRLASPVVHRRKMLFLKPEYWVVIDLLTGPARRHELEQLFHLMPGAIPRLELETNVAQVKMDDKIAMTIAPVGGEPTQAEIVTGATDPIQGWVSFYSGEKVPAPVLRYWGDWVLPTAFVTVLYPYPPDSYTEIKASELTVTGDSEVLFSRNQVSGLTVEMDEYTDTFAVEHGGVNTWKAFADFESDAEFVYVRRAKRDGSILKAAMFGGSSLSLEGKILLGTDCQRKGETGSGDAQ